MLNMIAARLLFQAALYADTMGYPYYQWDIRKGWYPVA